MPYLSVLKHVLGIENPLRNSIIDETPHDGTKNINDGMLGIIHIYYVTLMGVGGCLQ